MNRYLRLLALTALLPLSGCGIHISGIWKVDMETYFKLMPQYRLTYFQGYFSKARFAPNYAYDALLLRDIESLRNLPCQNCGLERIGDGLVVTDKPAFKAYTKALRDMPLAAHAPMEVPDLQNDTERMLRYLGLSYSERLAFNASAVPFEDPRYRQWIVMDQNAIRAELD